MESIKVSELENTKQINENDLLMIIQDKKNKNIKVSDFLSNNILELLTVSSIVPTECNIGDKYYNITTSKIYTATATNTWGTEGENPTSLYLYVDLEHKELYYFNGTTFVSYGGGSGGAGGDTLPIGGIIAFDSDTIPNGWLLCDGRAVSRTEYAELFKAIGTKHGSGDGSTTFNLPNPKGRTLVGKDSSDTDFNTLGKTGGEKTHTLTVDEMPSHTHKIQVRSGNIGDYYGDPPLTDGNAGNLIQGGDTKSTGGSQPHNNLQPYLVTNFIIKAKNTAVVKGEIIQEDGTASETNVYSAVAVDNKLKTNIVTGQEVATNYYEDGKRVYIMKIQLNGETATKKDEYIKTAISGLSNVRVIDIRGTAIHPNGATAILPSSNPSNCLSINYHKSNSTTENAIEIFCNTASWAYYTLEFKIYYTKN